MLVQLRIKDLAIIEEQEVHFSTGLNVITGETGAGKSIILQALELILGGKIKNDITRTGASSWLVEAIFDLKNVPVHVRDSLPDLLNEDELIISRSQNKNGKGRLYVNGHLASINVLREIATKIVNICSQGQFVSLLDTTYHLELIDGFAGNELNAALHEYKEAYEKYCTFKKYLGELESKVSLASRRRVELQILLDELRPLELTENLRSDLEEKVKLASQSERALQLMQEIGNNLNSGVGVYSILRKIQSTTQELQKLGIGSDFSREALVRANDEIAAFEQEIERQVSKVEINNAELEQMRDKLAEVARLERKFKLESNGLYRLWQEAEQEFLEFADIENIDQKRAELQKLQALALSLAEKISIIRKSASEKLSKLVVKDLKELNLPHANLSVNFTRREELGPKGHDFCELLISTNAGEELRPLRQVASGGELSRILLVLKKVLKDRTGVNVLIFDEVDSGISGQVARAVGEKLKSLAAGTQVLCITHLPQVASLADLHLLVEKQTVAGRTISEVRSLNTQERIEELARMLSGHSITDTARQTAKELMQFSA